MVAPEYEPVSSRNSMIHSDFLFVSRSDDRLDPAADREVADDSHAPRLYRADQIVENLIRHALVEDAAVAEFDHVVLQRFQLDADPIRNVRDADFAEVGQTGLRAERREFGATDVDLEVALGPRVGKRLEREAGHFRKF